MAFYVEYYVNEAYMKDILLCKLTRNVFVNNNLHFCMVSENVCSRRQVRFNRVVDLFSVGLGLEKV